MILSGTTTFPTFDHSVTIVSFSAMGKRKAFEGGGENEQPPRERDGPPAEKRIRFENSSIALFLFMLSSFLTPVCEGGWPGLKSKGNVSSLKNGRPGSTNNILKSSRQSQVTLGILFCC